MKSSDLRIGNYIQDEQSIIYKVASLNEKSILGEDLENKDLWENFGFIGISLTEEILLKCGFNKLGKYTFVCNNSLMQLEINVLNGNILHSILAIEIKYLHQLQNLYWCLCEKELNVNM